MLNFASSPTSSRSCIRHTARSAHTPVTGRLHVFARPGRPVSLHLRNGLHLPGPQSDRGDRLQHLRLLSSGGSRRTGAESRSDASELEFEESNERQTAAQQFQSERQQHEQLLTAATIVGLLERIGRFGALLPAFQLRIRLLRQQSDNPHSAGRQTGASVLHKNQIGSVEARLSTL